MTIKDVLCKGTEILKYANVETPVVEAGVILCFVLGCDKAYLYSHGDRMMDHGEQVRFFEMVNKRAEGMPVQYITGKQEFMSLDFAVNPAVLIPRQDTEVLVEAVIKHAEVVADKKGGQFLEILDIGTGSGCIAVSLAYYIKECCVTAVDVSEEALEIARLNASNLKVESKVTFVRSNLFSSLSSRPIKPRYDIIVSNPPYIPAGDIQALQREVRYYEPLTALDGGEDGLDFYRAIIRKAPDFLKPGGMLAFEVGCNQAGDVTRMMSDRYCNIQIIKDLSKIDRVVTGELILLCQIGNGKQFLEGSFSHAFEEYI